MIPVKKRLRSASKSETSVSGKQGEEAEDLKTSNQKASKAKKLEHKGSAVRVQASKEINKSSSTQKKESRVKAGRKSKQHVPEPMNIEKEVNTELLCTTSL